MRSTTISTQFKFHNFKRVRTFVDVHEALSFLKGKGYKGEISTHLRNTVVSNNSCVDFKDVICHAEWLAMKDEECYA